ncbi:bidirectional hydrogenase complex protein HoxU [Stieleria sp.]|uniref:bidirectional hydrogenase complex protein HoxU n=1 Tax=Stieleria sp. TaxID=2795976 RepID=UPI0035657316
MPGPPVTASTGVKVRVVTLKINEHDIGARETDSILDVAQANNIRIPSLCFLEGLSTWGACRLCVVEIEGYPRPVSACSTTVSEGMVITTHSDRLKRYRRTILELLFAERNHVCSVCVSNGHCELQDLAAECGMDHVRVPYRNQPYAVDSTHEMYRVDHNRCVLCTRCVRVCDEIEGAHTWDVMGRGIECQVITDLNQPWGDSSSCTSCGKCVQVCPTGALVKKGTAAGEMEKHDEFLPYLAQMRGNR